MLASCYYLKNRKCSVKLTANKTTEHYPSPVMPSPVVPSPDVLRGGI